MFRYFLPRVYGQPKQSMIGREMLFEEKACIPEKVYYVELTIIFDDKTQIHMYLNTSYTTYPISISLYAKFS